MGKKKKPTIYVADTENTVPDTEIYTNPDVVNTNPSAPTPTPVLNPQKVEGNLKETHVWAWGFMKANENTDLEQYHEGDTVEQFLKVVSAVCKNGDIVMFHNLAYDGPLILSELMRQGYVYDEACKGFDKKPRRKMFVSTISDGGAWYELSVTFGVSGGTKTIHFRDSLKLLPFSVESIAKSLKTKHQKLVGDIDYTKPRPVGYEPTEMERKYVRNDVMVMAEAIGKLITREVNLTDYMTIGHAAMDQFKTILGGGNIKRGRTIYDMLFTEGVEPVADMFMRPAYRGGWCYVHRRSPYIRLNEAIDLRKRNRQRKHMTINQRMKWLGNTYDVNSLYPSAMRGKMFPIGHPTILKGEDAANFDLFDHTRPYVVNLTIDFELKPKHLPFIQIRNSSRFVENEYPASSEGPVEISLTGAVWPMFAKHYNIHEMEVHRVFVFEGKKGIFDDYIDYWFRVKDTADNPVDYMIAKLMLNNLYGKMAQAQERNSLIPSMGEDGKLEFDVENGEHRGGHIAVGAYITDYARVTTVEAAQKNYDNFLYADTDSIHIIGEAVGIEVSDKLGAWDHEAVWDMARFTRQKTYIERVVWTSKKGEVDPYLDIKAAGAPSGVKERLQYKVTSYDPVDGYKHYRLVFDDNENILNERRTDDEVLERFTVGLTEAGKLTRRKVVGGSILIETTFKIHDPSQWVDPETGLAPTKWTVLD